MILLLGASGYVGQAFAAELRRRGLSFVPLVRQALDYSRFDTLFPYVRAIKPRFLINAAGYVGYPDVDDCETHRAETVQANILLPQTVARVCYLTNTPWGHVSSGSIYSGARIEHDGPARIEPDLSRPDVHRLFASHPDSFHGFTELDEPNFTFRSPPCSFYSGTKALAEEALRWFDQTYLWRPRILFDGTDHPRNYLSRLLRLPPEPDSIDSLSHRGDFVRACLDLWERGAAPGVYHVVNPGAVTTRSVAESAARELKTSRVEFGGRPENLEPAGCIPRSHCLLDGSKLLAAGIALRPVREALAESLAHWPSENAGGPWPHNPLPAPAAETAG